MGIAAGGCIKQNIYKDSRSPSAYDEEAAERVWIHTVSTAAWEVGAFLTPHIRTILILGSASPASSRPCPRSRHKVSDAVAP
jgi:hypothetical protein